MKRFIYFFLLFVIHSMAFGQTFYAHIQSHRRAFLYFPDLSEAFKLSVTYQITSRHIPCVSNPRYTVDSETENIDCQPSISLDRSTGKLDFLGLIDYQNGSTISSFATVAYVNTLSEWNDIIPDANIRSAGNIVDTPRNSIDFRIREKYYMLRFFPNVTTISPSTFQETVSYCLSPYYPEDQCLIKHPKNGNPGDEDYYYGERFKKDGALYPNGAYSFPYGYGIDDRQRFYFQAITYNPPNGGDAWFYDLDPEIYTRTKDILTAGSRTNIEKAIKEKFVILNINPDNCVIDWANSFTCTAANGANSHQFTIHTIVGYSQDHSRSVFSDFPVSSANYDSNNTRTFSLRGGVKVSHNNITDNTREIFISSGNLFVFSMNKTQTFSSPRRHPRALFEGNYDFITKLNSGEVYNKDYTIQKTQEDGTVVDYIADLSDEDGSHSVFLDSYDKRLEVRDHICTPTTSIFDGEEIEDEDCTHDEYNYLEFNSSLTSDQIESVKTLGKEIFPTSQTHGDLPQHGYGADCISQQMVDNHYLSVENDTSRMLLQDTDGNIIWEKKKTDPHNQITCLFPTQGTSSLANNQRLIEYNKYPSDVNTEKTYLLSADKTKITIKDGNLIKVITKTEYEAQKGVIANITPLQSYSLN